MIAAGGRVVQCCIPSAKGAPCILVCLLCAFFPFGIGQQCEFFKLSFFLQRSDHGAGQRTREAEGDEQSGSGRLPVREMPAIELPMLRHDGLRRSECHSDLPGANSIPTWRAGLGCRPTNEPGR